MNLEGRDIEQGAIRPQRRKTLGGLIGKFFTGKSHLFKPQWTKELERNNTLIAEMVRSEVQRVIDAAQGTNTAHYRSILLASHTIALRESAEFAQQFMPTAETFANPHDTLRHALSLAPSGGLALEFGVYSGTTLGIIAHDRQSKGQIYGFDSFKGLPENWRSGIPKGAFATDHIPQVKGAELVIGWFHETLPGFLERTPGIVDFLHVDCDIYSSTKTVFDLVGPRLRPGSIVVFDDFFNYPSWQQHEYKAWHEFLDSSGLRCSYEAYTNNNEQVVARIIG